MVVARPWCRLAFALTITIIVAAAAQELFDDDAEDAAEEEADPNDEFKNSKSPVLRVTCMGCLTWPSYVALLPASSRLPGSPVTYLISAAYLCYLSPVPSMLPVLLLSTLIASTYYSLTWLSGFVLFLSLRFFFR